MKDKKEERKKGGNIKRHLGNKKDRKNTYVSGKTKGCKHRRRMETEGKAKVVTSVWESKFVQFLDALSRDSCFA